MISRKLRPATKKEFDRFVLKYPCELELSMTRICEPPLQRFYDPNLPWDDAVVATVTIPKMSIFPNAEPEYHILAEEPGNDIL